MAQKLTYILSNLDKALAFEWIAEALDKDAFDISFILLNPQESYLETYLKSKKIKVHFVKYHGKKDILKALWQTFKILRKEKPTIIHTHLFDASLIGLLAGKILGIKKRIYTRHHATLHHLYFPRAVYYDKFINKLATHIIAISENVQNILVKQEGVSPTKITLIHHGFKLEDFTKADETIINDLKIKYKLTNHYPVIGVVARYTHWKGIQYLIPAFEQLLLDFPNACLVLANATGDFKENIQILLKNIPTENYVEIPFEKNITALYHLFDMYVHVPIDPSAEAFGQTYIEALAIGIPSIFTLSGIASEFIIHEHNALVVPFKSVEQIYESMIKLLTDKNLTAKLTQQGIKDIGAFNLPKMISELEQLYSPSKLQL